MSVFPQGYPLWLAANHDAESPIRVGRVIGWDGVNPLVAWESELGDVRQVGPPDRGEMWWLGETPAAVRQPLDDLARRTCPEHGRMVQKSASPERWACSQCTRAYWAAA